MLTGVHDGRTEWSELSVLGHDFCKTFAVKKTVFRPCFVTHWQTIHFNYREMLANSGEILETPVKSFFGCALRRQLIRVRPSVKRVGQIRPTRNSHFRDDPDQLIDRRLTDVKRKFNCSDRAATPSENEARASPGHPDRARGGVKKAMWTSTERFIP